MAEPAPVSSRAGLDVELNGWAASAIKAGWLDERDAEVLDGLGDAGAGALFDDEERPLVVGLFGGTGVGKSSLLNRIAGQAVARVSAERPTSRGVTAYLHRSRRLDALPAEFPLDRLVSSVHHEERWRDVLWIDMPDVDSVATEHRDQVRQWLPHLDVVLYVASPERYRDDRGWQLLLEHADRHAWLFVLNQWDRGDARQPDDWRRQLASAGFEDPLIFRTVAAVGEGVKPPPDDFDALLDTLASLADRQLIDELDRRGTLARTQLLLEAAGLLEERALGPPADDVLTRWEAFHPVLLSGVAGALNGRVNGVTARSREAGDATLDGSAGQALFDATAQARLQESLTRFAQEQTDAGRLPRRLVRERLSAPFDAAIAALPEQFDAAAGASLAQPGTQLQRALHRVLTLATGLLPVAAAGWAGVRILDAFRRGGSDPAAYLGTNFAITAGLLIGLAFVVPWWLARRCRPSRAGALARGLSNGVDSGLAALQERIAGLLADIDAERRAQRDALHGISRSGMQRLMPSRTRADGSGSTALPEQLRRLMPAAPGDADRRETR